MSTRHKEITVVAMDFKNHELTRRAVELTLQRIDPKELLIISDREFYTGGTFIKAAAPASFVDYAWMMMKWIGPLIDTGHALYVQYDGMPWNTACWDDDFLNYDYIGAVWPWEPEGRNVGNGGFSLRSKRFLDAARDNAVTFDADRKQAEDASLCIDHRLYLENMYNIKFASTEVAHRFSHEVQQIGPTWGFHGQWNLFKYLGHNDIEFYMQHLDFNGWNIYVWHHVLVEMCARGLQDQLNVVIPKLKLHKPEFLQDLVKWFVAENFPNQQWLILELMRG
jgi:hypothetical protein